MLKFDQPKFERHKPSIVVKSKWLRIALESFSLVHPQNGSTIGPAEREFIVCREAVAVIVHCPSQNKVLMSRQFRMPVMFKTNNPNKGWIYEAIAGLVDEGENPLRTAIREVKEEAGVDIDDKNVTYVGGFFTSPGISTEKIHVFTATVEDAVPEYPSGGLEAEKEAIVSEWLSYADIRFLLNDESIQDFKTYTALKSLGL